MISVSKDGQHIEKKIGFPTRFLIVKAGASFFVSRRVELLSSPAGDNMVYISHTPAYEVKLYSFETNSIVRRITREYKRVKVSKKTRKYVPGGSIGKFSIDEKQWFEMPVAKYHLDIQKLLHFNGKLWVITSTVIDDNRVLVDVYDKNGIYVDNFYIECPVDVIPYKIKNWIKAVNDNFLYAVEEDEKGQKFIKRYKVGN
jgi:hypothetical protein